MSVRRWAARLLRGLVILLLLVDAFGKLAGVVPVVEGTARLGYPVGFVLVIGLLELLCTIAYAVPRTAAVGAVLLTGYLGVCRRVASADRGSGIHARALAGLHGGDDLDRRLALR